MVTKKDRTGYLPKEGCPSKKYPTIIQIPLRWIQSLHWDTGNNGNMS
jgi:hypothetical protein